MTKILFLGDVHGYWASLLLAMDYGVNSLDVDCIIQVGDFGFYPGHIKSLINFKTKYGFKDFPIHFIDGNHEDHVYLYKSNKKKLKENNIFYHPRGSILDIEDKKLDSWEVHSI